MYFRRSLILQPIFFEILDDFSIKTYQGLQLNQGGQMNIKCFKNFEQKYIKSEKNPDFGLNLAKNGLS